MKIFNSRYLFSKQSGLRTLLEKEIIPERKQSIYYFIVELTELRKKNGEKVIGQVKVDDAVLGMRGLPVMLYDGSSLDPIQGITFRGHSIPEFCQKSQKAPKGE
jgi:citrate synthase